MLQELIKLAIKKINTFGETQYVITKGDAEVPPQILIKRRDGAKETVVEDLDCIRSITATENTLFLHDEGAIFVISPGNYTYHGTC